MSKFFDKEKELKAEAKSEARKSFLLCKDTPDNRAYRLCLHFKSEQELLGFGDFCETNIRKKIDSFTQQVLDSFNKSGQDDFNTWFNSFNQTEVILNLFLNNSLSGIREIIGGAGGGQQAKDFSSHEKSILANKLKEKFQVKTHATGQLAVLFDLLVKKPSYFSNNKDEQLSSTLRYHSHYGKDGYYFG